MYDENQLVKQVLHGNRQAFGLLVQQYEKLVFHVINKLVKRHSDVEDICQEVFIKVYKGLPGFAFESKLSTWIARIAYTTAINHMRKTEGKAMAFSDEPMANWEDEQDSPEELIAKKDFSAHLNRLIEELPAAYKIVITLYHLYQFSYEEVEQVTGMPAGTVKGNLFRARKMLKQKMEAFVKKDHS
jgi:RNA polymerase sigma factor (sigma-70 family)